MCMYAEGAPMHTSQPNLSASRNRRKLRRDMRINAGVCTHNKVMQN